VQPYEDDPAQRGGHCRIKANDTVGTRCEINRWPLVEQIVGIEGDLGFIEDPARGLVWA